MPIYRGIKPLTQPPPLLSLSLSSVPFMKIKVRTQFACLLFPAFFVGIIATDYVWIDRDFPKKNDTNKTKRKEENLSSSFGTKFSYLYFGGRSSIRDLRIGMKISTRWDRTRGAIIRVRKASCRRACGYQFVSRSQQPDLVFFFIAFYSFFPFFLFWRLK